MALAALLAPGAAPATTIKHLEQWTLVFPIEGSTELGPQHRRDLVRVVESIERRCVAGPMGGVLMVIEAMEAKGTGPAAQRYNEIARGRIRNVHAMLDRLGLSARGTLVDDLTTEREWQLRLATMSKPMRPPAHGEVMLEMACNPQS